MLTDNSKYKKQHNEVISYVREQIGIDLNQYRDGAEPIQVPQHTGISQAR